MESCCTHFTATVSGRVNGNNWHGVRSTTGSLWFALAQRRTDRGLEHARTSAPAQVLLHHSRNPSALFTFERLSCHIRELYTGTAWLSTEPKSWAVSSCSHLQSCRISLSLSLTDILIQYRGRNAACKNYLILVGVSLCRRVGHAPTNQSLPAHAGSLSTEPISAALHILTVPNLFPTPCRLCLPLLSYVVRTQ